MIQDFSTSDFASACRISKQKTKAAKQAAAKESGLDFIHIESIGLEAGLAAIRAMKKVIDKELSGRAADLVMDSIMISFGWVGLKDFEEFTPDMLAIFDRINEV